MEPMESSGESRAGLIRRKIQCDREAMSECSDFSTNLGHCSHSELLVKTMTRNR